MKLIRCHIMNYGCLHDFTFEFQSGLNIINRPNGWGKSTFSSFLCAMLYGLNSSARRSILDNDRKHYQPWQGGTFGGSLEFETEQKQYRAERIFGQKEKEDIFTLYDLKTMLPCHDFTSQLGYELFGIDKAGFLQSIYIPQGKSATEYNDSLVSRLTSITPAEDDINQYEQAISQIDSTLRFYIKTGKRGQIAALKAESDQLAYQLQEVLSAGQKLADSVGQLNELEKKKQLLTEQLNHIQKQISDRTQQEILSSYELLLNQQQEKEEQVELLEDFFHDQLPDEHDITSYLESCKQLSLLEEEKLLADFTPEEAEKSAFLEHFFQSREDIPSDCENPSETHSAPDSGCIFSANQQQLLIDSGFYPIETSVLFAAEGKQNDFLPEILPDEEQINELEKLHLNYSLKRKYFNQQKLHLESVSQKMISLNSAFKEETQATETCKQALQDLKDSSASIQPSADDQSSDTSDFSPQWKLSDFDFSLALLLSGLIFLIFIPFIGNILLAGSIICAGYRIFTILHQRKPAEEADNSTPPENDLNREIIQLETELKLHEKSLAQLQDQLMQLQEEEHTSLQEQECCQRELSNLVQQLNTLAETCGLLIPVEGNLMEVPDDFMIQLTRIQHKREQQQHREQQRHILYSQRETFYQHLKEQHENYIHQARYFRQLQCECNDLKRDIIQYLSPYFSVSEKESSFQLEQKLQELHEKTVLYHQSLTELRTASDNISLFLKKYPQINKDEQINRSTGLFSDVCEPEIISISQLQEQESALRTGYMTCVQDISLLKSQILQTEESACKQPVLEEKKRQLDQQIASYTEHARILTLTRQYLNQAKYNFTESYLRSIEKNFFHYAQLLKKPDLQNAAINSDFQIILGSSGTLRSPDWYSQGTRDLIYFCSRLAIIEDAFAKEPPFLLLDDPFVNMDDSSLAQLSQLLSEIAPKWQILYFTCHTSREF